MAKLYDEILAEYESSGIAKYNPEESLLFLMRKEHVDSVLEYIKMDKITTAFGIKIVIAEVDKPIIVIKEI